MGRLVVALVAVAATSSCGAAHAPDSESLRTIHIHPDMTFVPTDTKPDGALSSAEAFHVIAPKGRMAPGLVATLGYLTVAPAPTPTRATSYSLNRKLVWGFSLPHSCPPEGLGVGVDPSASAASPASPPTACSSTEWIFANARTGQYVLGTWQMS
jgi:hypothetical protein